MPATRCMSRLNDPTHKDGELLRGAADGPGWRDTLGNVTEGHVAEFDLVGQSNNQLSMLACKGPAVPWNQRGVSLAETSGKGGWKGGKRVQCVQRCTGAMADIWSQ